MTRAKLRRGRWLMAFPILAGALALLAATGPVASRPVNEPKGKDRVLLVWGEESGGLHSRIWIDKMKVSGKEPVNVHYEIQNVSRDERTVMHSGFWPNHRIDVLGPDGKLARLTAHGQQVRSAFAPGGPREKNVPLVLRPGAIDSAWVVYDLRGLYVLDEPGTYSVQYLYQDTPAQPPVKSNVLKIDIVK